MTVSARYEPRQQHQAGERRIYTANIKQAWARKGVAPLAAVSAGAQALWMHMADTYQSRTWLRRDDGAYVMDAHPTQHTLARALGVSEETIRRRTRELVAVGLLQVLRIAIDGTKRKRCYYTLLAPMKHSTMPQRRERVKQAPRGCVKQRMENPAPTKREQHGLRIVDHNREELERVEREHGRERADRLREMMRMQAQHSMAAHRDAAALLVGEILDTSGGVPIRLDNSEAAELLVDACREIDGLERDVVVSLLRRGMNDAIAETLDIVKHMSDRTRAGKRSLPGWFVETVRKIHAKGGRHVAR